MLRSDSSNVVDLIKEEYKKITSSIVLKDNSTKNFKLTYRSSCLDDEFKETQKCKGLRVGAEVEFEIELELLNCPANKNNFNEIIKINPVGVNEDDLILNVEMACDCECEKQDNFVYSNKSCSKGNGYLKCGVCECLQEYYGKTCECKYDDTFDFSNLKDNRLNKGCYKSINDSKVCSGNGECSCNTCFCDEPYTGKHCECDPFSCERTNNLVCSGNGVCNCGKCDCYSNWKDNACQCSTLNDTCLDPLSNKLCNDNGECVCGKCECKEDDNNLYSGKYCQKCSDCVDHFCLSFNQIVNQQIIDKSIEIKTDNFTSYLIDDFNLINITDSSEDLETCLFLSNNSCAYTYKYRQDKDGRLIVYSLKHGICQTKIDIKKTATSIVAGTLISGIIALIIWKLITYWYDKHEFEMFEKQIQNLSWDLRSQNPLFRKKIKCVEIQKN